jgi:polyhydroxybutyrate depolymerase
MRSRRQLPVLSIAGALLLAASCSSSGADPGPLGGAGGSGATAGASGSTGSGGASGSGAGGTGGSGAGTGGSSAPSSGCGMTGAPTGAMTTQTITVAGAERSYVLFVPTSYDANTRYPLIFAWHGLGGTGMLARSYFRLEQAAANQAIFVYPSALANAQGMAAWDLAANGVDVQLFDALLASVSGRYCIDGNRVFSTGHSYGGFMTNRLGCSRGDVLRAIAPVAGGPPFGGGSGGSCVGQVGAWIAHGMNDGTVDFAQGEAARDRLLMANGCGTTTTPTPPDACVAYDGCMPDLPVHWCVHMMDHNWPTYAGAGIWTFFNAFK